MGVKIYSLKYMVSDMINTHNTIGINAKPELKKYKTIYIHTHIQLQ